MKKRILLTGAFALACVFISCEKENVEIKDENNEISVTDLREQIENDEATKHYNEEVRKVFLAVMETSDKPEDRKMRFKSGIEEHVTSHFDLMLSKYSVLGTYTKDEQLELVFGTSIEKREEIARRVQTIGTGEREDELCDEFYEDILAFTEIEIEHNVDLTTELWDVYWEYCG